MTGAVAALFGASGGNASLGSLTATLTSGRDTDLTTNWDTGYVAATATEASNLNGASSIGSMTAVTYGPAAVRAIYWSSNVGYTGNGAVYVELTGNRSASAISQLLVDGVNMGTVALIGYNSVTNNTTFRIGGTRLNPFGANGSTHSIALS